MSANSLKKILIISSIVLIGSSVASGQMRRVAMPMGVGPHTHMSQERMVYEYDYVDRQPQFPGGDCAMLSFINSERRYPASAYENKIEGRVLCGFVVNADGSISDVSVMRGVEDSLNREAVRIISEMPRWNAGEVSGERVPVYCIVPIAFRL